MGKYPIFFLYSGFCQQFGNAYIGFELGCTWDEEHGAGVMTYKERVVEIGQAGTSFSSWAAYNDNGADRPLPKMLGHRNLEKKLNLPG